MSGFSVFLSVVVFGFFFFKRPVFGFYRKRKAVFRFFFSFFHVARRHPGDVPGESGPQKAVEVLRNFIAIALK